MQVCGPKPWGNSPVQAPAVSEFDECATITPVSLTSPSSYCLFCIHERSHYLTLSAKGAGAKQLEMK